MWKVPSLLSSWVGGNLNHSSLQFLSFYLATLGAFSQDKNSKYHDSGQLEWILSQKFTNFDLKCLSFNSKAFFAFTENEHCCLLTKTKSVIAGHLDLDLDLDIIPIITLSLQDTSSSPGARKWGEYTCDLPPWTLDRFRWFIRVKKSTSYSSLAS